MSNADKLPTWRGMKAKQCPNCYIIHDYREKCPNCGDPNDMLYCDIDGRIHGPKRRPKYPRWLLDQLKKQYEFAYPYRPTPGNEYNTAMNERQQNSKRESYAIAFLNAYDLLQPQLNALKVIAATMDNCHYSDAKKISKTYKVLTNLQNKASDNSNSTSAS